MNELEKLACNADRVAAYLEAQDEAALLRRITGLHSTQSGDSQLNSAAAETAAALREKLDAHARLSRQLAHFDAQMEHIAATRGVIHAQIVRVSVAEEAFAQRGLAEQVLDLRHEVDGAAEALHEAYRELDWSTEPRAVHHAAPTIVQPPEQPKQTYSNGGLRSGGRRSTIRDHGPG